MPILDTSARFKALQDMLGPTRGPNSPDSYTTHLWVGDPAFDESYEMPDTTELEDDSTVSNGYAPVTIDSDGFAVDELGIAQTVQFPDATEEWPDTATHWLLRDAATGEGWFYSLLSEPLDVTAAGRGPAVEVTVFFDDDVDPLA